MTRIANNFLVAGCVLLAAVGYSEAQNVSAVRYSHNGRSIATGSDDGAIQLYDRSSGRRLWSVSGNGGQVMNIQFFPGDRELVAFERNGRILFINKTTGDISKTLRLDFSAYDGDIAEGLSLGEIDETGESMAIAGDISPVVYLLDIRRARNERKEIQLNEWLFKKFPDAGNIVMHVKRPTKASAAVINELITPGSSALVDMHFSTQQKLVIATDYDGLLFAWRLGDAAKADREQNETAIIRKYGREDPEHTRTACAISNKGAIATLGYTRKFGCVQIWDVANVEMAAAVNGDDEYHPGGVLNRVVFNANGDKCVTSDEISNCVWSVKGRQLTLVGKVFVQIHGGPTERPNGVSFAPDDHEIAIGVDDSVAFVELKTMQVTGYLGENRPEREPETSLEEARKGLPGDHP